jgi:hypothetical protein
LAIELQCLIDLDVEIELTGFEMPEIDVILEEARRMACARSQRHLRYEYHRHQSNRSS